MPLGLLLPSVSGSSMCNERPTGSTGGHGLQLESVVYMTESLRHRR